MSIQDAVETLIQRNAESAADLRAIMDLHDATREMATEEFFEPVSAIALEKERRTLLAAGADDLFSWTRHVAGSTVRRMGALEPSILESVAAGKLLAATVLLRVHIEAAAMAAHSLERLTDAAATADISILLDLIPQTLFGTALTKHHGKALVAEFLSLTEGATIRICHAIESLDKFYYLESADGKLPIAYSLLCEFSHPNHRGAMHFMRSEERPGGWAISYDRTEESDVASDRMVFETLLVSMRGGYAACGLLLCWRFAQPGLENLEWHPPGLEDADRIWRTFLQRPIDPDAA